jgi:hypothetical protein
VLIQLYVFDQLHINYNTLRLQVLGEEWQTFLDWRYKHINSLTKFHFVLVEHVARMLNFR